MSSMDNHRRRSRRGNNRKRAAFGSMARRSYITPVRHKVPLLGWREWFALMRTAKRGRASRAVAVQPEPAAE